MCALNYPNGSKFPFKHRGGSEARSRLFCVWNFSQPFKPDYGRKSYPQEVKPFVITMTKELMAKMKNHTRDYLLSSRTVAPRGVVGENAARQAQDDTTRRINADRIERGPYILNR